MIIGLVYMQKRTLELTIEVKDENSRIDAKSLIFNKKVYDNGPNVVVIGGGAGLNTVLQGLKKYTSNITAIVTVSDYGNGISNSRRQLELLPLDDIKSSIVALSENDVIMEHLMNYEFHRGNLRGIDFGDIYLSAMKEIFGDFTESIERSSEVLNITGKVLPVTLDEIKICAELKDGTVVESKNQIPEVVQSKVSKINRIFISPSNCRPAPGVLEAIEKADAVVIGPGSLYTNVIANLLIKGVAKTIRESKALKIYISNLMTEPGQTDDYSLSEHIDAIIEHAGKGIVDFCICDTAEVVPEFIRKYNKQGSHTIEQDIQKVKAKGINVIPKDMSIIKDEFIRHNPDVVGSSIVELICEVLRFKDKQNDPQYLLLNSKLKEEKKKQKKTNQNKKKIAQKQEKSKPKRARRKQSKFTSKYSERIESIQTSDEKRVENQEKLKNK